MDIVEMFVDQIIRDRNFQPHEAASSGLSLEKLHSMIKADLKGRAQRRLNRALVENMAPAHLGAFVALLEQRAPDATVMAFCRDHVADLETVMARALVELRTEFLEGSQSWS